MDSAAEDLAVVYFQFLTTSVMFPIVLRQKKDNMLEDENNDHGGQIMCCSCFFAIFIDLGASVLQESLLKTSRK